ncbi:MAG: hypothetical protein IAX21_07315 [Candidatus Bathyarchaeota archaeon]|nr:MAG: hypothetical protein IAX21_07315 [Candidatus Bathyarchaeota archaeon]
MVKNNLKKTLGSLRPGDLICVEWCDASVGKSSNSGIRIDIPVKSWGIYVGVFGERAKHIVLAQNSFRYSDGLFDLDYTAIPASWALELDVVAKSHVPEVTAKSLVNSFLLGGHRAFKNQRTFQRRASTHERLD